VESDTASGARGARVTINSNKLQLQYEQYIMYHCNGIEYHMVENVLDCVMQVEFQRQSRNGSNRNENRLDNEKTSFLNFFLVFLL
jgi:hypothetical protein